MRPPRQQSGPHCRGPARETRRHQRTDHGQHTAPGGVVEIHTGRWSATMRATAGGPESAVPIPYGRDWPDRDSWVDRDAAVDSGDGPYLHRWTRRLRRRLRSVGRRR